MDGLAKVFRGRGEQIFNTLAGVRIGAYRKFQCVRK